MKTETQLLANNNRPEQSNAPKTKIDKIIVNYRITDVFIQVRFLKICTPSCLHFLFKTLRLASFVIVNIQSNSPV